MAGGPSEDDSFAEFLSQEQAHSAAYVEPVEVSSHADANATLRQLLECSQRQEQLLGKVCSLLVSLDEKIGRIATSQERLEVSMQQRTDLGASQGIAAGSPASTASTMQRPAPQRGSLVQPPGKIGPSPSTAGGASFVGAAPQTVEEQRLATERLAAERVRIEEEGRRREEELARRREEEERRKREEAERLRAEEERRREEERQRKAQLEKKTGSLMSNLIAGSAGNSLFGDDEPKKRSSKGGLFDD